MMSGSSEEDNSREEKGEPDNHASSQEPTLEKVAPRAESQRLNVLKEIISSEKTFQAYMLEVIERIHAIYLDVDKRTQANLDKFMEAYTLRNPFADMIEVIYKKPPLLAEMDPGKLYVVLKNNKATCYVLQNEIAKEISLASMDENVAKGINSALAESQPLDNKQAEAIWAHIPVEEQIVLHENTISSGMQSDDFKENFSACLAAVLQYDQLQAFCSKEIHGKNKASSIYALDGEKKPALSLSSLLIMAVQRYPRYSLLLRDAIKNTPSNSASYGQFIELADAIERQCSLMNSAMKAQSNVTHLLLARRAAGLIMQDIRVLQTAGVAVDPGKFVDAMYKMQESGDLGEARTNLRAYLLQLYSQVYVEHRKVGTAWGTNKDPQLKAMEKFISSVEKALENAGIEPLFLHAEVTPLTPPEKEKRAELTAERKGKARHIDAKGTNNREDAIFGSVSFPYEELNLAISDYLQRMETPLGSSDKDKLIAKIQNSYQPFMPSEQLDKTMLLVSELIAAVNASSRTNEDKIAQLKLKNELVTSISLLQSFEIHNRVVDLYERAKLIIDKLAALNASASDKETTPIIGQFANILKEVEKMGREGKRAWNTYVKQKGEHSANDLKYMSAFLIPVKQYIEDNETLSGSYARRVLADLSKNTELFKVKFSESKSESHDDAEIPQGSIGSRGSVSVSSAPLDVKSEMKPVPHDSSDLLAQRALKREIFGLMAAHLLEAKKKAIALGFDQYSIFEKLAERVNNINIPDQAMLDNIKRSEKNVNGFEEYLTKQNVRIRRGVVTADQLKQEEDEVVKLKKQIDEEKLEEGKSQLIQAIIAELEAGIKHGPVSVDRLKQEKDDMIQFSEYLDKEKLQLAKYKRIIPDELHFNDTASVWYADVIRAYTDAAIFQPEKNKLLLPTEKNKSLLPILRKFIVRFDSAVQKLSTEFTEGGAALALNGVIFKADSVPTKAMLDDIVFGRMLPANANQHNFPPLGRELINHVFDTVTFLVNHRPQGEYERTAFENALKVVMHMGIGAVNEWNRRANTDFYELTIKTRDDKGNMLTSLELVIAENKKLLNSFSALTALPGKEADRREEMVNLAIGCFKANTVSPDYPKDDRDAAIALLKNANQPPANDRRELRRRLQFAIYELHKTAYSQGRKRGLKSKATPYLAAEIGFVEKLDEMLLSKGQKPLIVQDAALYQKCTTLTSDDNIEKANLIWRQAESVFSNRFPEYIEALFDAVKKDFDKMVAEPNVRKALAEYESDFKKENLDKPYVKAVTNLVNTLKAIERMSKGNTKAKELWNKSVSGLKGQYGNFAPLLKVNTNEKIHDKAIEKLFGEIVETDIKNYQIQDQVSRLFGDTVQPFKDAMKDLQDLKRPDNATMATQYNNYKKNKVGAVYAARVLLVSTLMKVQDKGAHGVKVWNELVNGNAGSYMHGFAKIMQLEQQPVTEAMAKKRFEDFLTALKNIHDKKNPDQNAALSKFFEPGTVVRPHSPEEKKHAQLQPPVSKQGTQHSHSAFMFKSAPHTRVSSSPAAAVSDPEVLPGKPTSTFKNK
jgi:predicted DNA-binding protein YlxM (UPF0122 family)